MITPILVRQEKSEDHPIVFDLIEHAFRELEISDHTEHEMVERLRHGNSFIPALSLVAEQNNHVIGHILFSKIHVVSDSVRHETLALAPVSVMPSHQKRGIGGQLIKAGHEIARSLGFTSVILVGHKTYYPRFGYVPTSRFNITMPFPVAEANAMAIELVEGGLANVQGQVEYPKAFFE